MFDVEKLRAFIERADNADAITRADERFRAERYMWNERAAILALAEREKRLAAENRTLKREVGLKDKALHDRNVALDGMGWAWCDGGCSSGTGRFTGLEVNEEMVVMVERNTKRLRTWLTNKEYRARRALG